MRRVGTVAIASVLLDVMTLLGACAGEDDQGEQATTGAAIDPSQPIEITVTDDGVTPNGSRVRVERGQTLRFVVTADRAGEFHVHSIPEQTLAFGAGTTELELTIGRPGVADMELHEPALTVLQLEVR